MGQNRPCDVSPTGDQDKYSIALVKESGEWWGLDIPLYQIHPSTANPPAPLQRVNQNSFHAGRGADRFTPDSYSFYESLNGWSTTPGKYHATLMPRASLGLFTSTGNTAMPEANGVTWKPLVGASRIVARAVGFGGSFTVEKISMFLRKRVPAGTVGAPNTLTMQFCSDTAGNPGAVLYTATLTAADILDVTTQFYTFSVSIPVTAATFWIKLIGGTGDKNNACWEVGVDTTSSAAKRFSGTTWNAITWAPYFKLDANVPKFQFKFFLLDGALYALGLHDNGATATPVYINGTRGRATGVQSSTTLQDTAHGAYGATAYPTNRFQACIIRIIRGTGQGQVRGISSNTGDTFTVSPAWDITPVAGDSEYVVYSSNYFFPLTPSVSMLAVGAPRIQNSIVYFPHGDATNLRKMRVDYTATQVHAWAIESTNNNKAYYLETGYDTAKGEPNLWRANVRDAAGTPAGKSMSVSRSSTAPAGVALPFATDLTFGAPILVGDNSNLITRIIEHEGALYILKEDGLFIAQNDRVVRVKMGTETAPDPDNGRAACVAGDKNLYVSWRSDVYIITGGGAYSTGLKNNLPDRNAGVVYSLHSAEGWIFAAVNGGTDSYSSIFKYSIDTRSWSEHWRAPMKGQRIRNIQWQPSPETRNRLWWDCEGDIWYQGFPLNGIRPYDDKTLRYWNEADLTLSTVDLGTTDPKFFAVLTVNSQGLAQLTDSETGHYIVVECQTDSDVGSDNWEHIGYVMTSPSASVNIHRTARSIRIRLRLISNEITDPVILETVSMSLFTRNRLAHEFSMQAPISSDDEEQNSVDLLMALREMAQTAEPILLKSRFTLFHDRVVTMADEPKYQLEELDPANTELEAQVWIKLSEVI